MVWLRKRHLWDGEAWGCGGDEEKAFMGWRGLEGKSGLSVEKQRLNHDNGNFFLAILPFFMRVNARIMSMDWASLHGEFRLFYEKQYCYQYYFNSGDVVFIQRECRWASQT